MQNWGNKSDIEVTRRNAWKDLRCGISSITGTAITMKTPCWNNSAGVLDIGFPYRGASDPAIDSITWLENAYELLDSSNEWYLDRTSGYIYYIPRSIDNMSNAEVIVPIVEKLIDANGTPGNLTTVNDTDSNIQYSGSWSVNANRTYGDLNKDVHYTGTNDNYAQYTFNGTGINYVTETNTDEGNVDVYIDGVFQQTVNTYSTTRLAQQVVYSKSGLSLGNHTIKLIKKSGVNMLLDGFIVVPDVVRYIHNIQFIGITFSYATWLQPNGNEGYADNKAGILWVGSLIPTKTMGNISFQRAKNIRIDSNKFKSMGGVAIDFGLGSQSNTIIGNSISDISSGGVYVGEVTDYNMTDPLLKTDGNTVKDNFIYKIGVEYDDAVGIWFGYSINSVIDHNEIWQTPYSGMSVGWGWGWATTQGSNYSLNNQISNNYIHEVMKILHDGGPIYTLGSQGTSTQKTKVFGNFLQYGNRNNNGLYHDEGSAWVDTYNNIVNDMYGRWTGMWINTIHDITIHDNYTDNPDYANNGVNVTLTNNTTVTNGSWPAAARTIASNAGLEASYLGMKSFANVSTVDDNNIGSNLNGTGQLDLPALGL